MSEITFKEPHLKDQYEARPKALKEVCEYFVQLSDVFGIPALVTRVTDRVEHESGVHPAGRAVDFRSRTFTDAQCKAIVNAINAKFPRIDGKLVAIHHCVDGGAWHYHFQIPAAWAWTVN